MYDVEKIVVVVAAPNDRNLGIRIKRTYEQEVEQMFDETFG